MHSLSIIIPAYNEEKNLIYLLRELIDELSLQGIKSWEVIVIDDGSEDKTSKFVGKLHKAKRQVKLITFRKNEGKALALQAGFDLAKGDVIITMDADGQDDPKEIKRFLNKIGEGVDMVSGWKKDRQDTFIKNKTSKLFNCFANLLLKTKIHDSNCGFKAFKKEVVKSLYLYGELHRYIPTLVEANGYSITEIKVNHRKRKYGISKYGSIRFIRGGLDLITVAFITRYSQRPLHIFGGLGMIFSTMGFVIGVYLSWLRLVEGEKIGDRPLLLLAILLLVVGIQIAMTGLLGELITVRQKKIKKYHIKTLLE